MRIEDKIALPQVCAPTRYPCHLLLWLLSPASCELSQGVRVPPSKNLSKKWRKWKRKKIKRLRISALRWQFQKSSSLTFIFSLNAPGRSLGGKDYLPAVLLCNSLCKQFCWNKLTLRCSLTLPAAWEMITERYWAKQPQATLRQGSWWHPVFFCFFFNLWRICECVWGGEWGQMGRKIKTTRLRFSRGGWKAKNRMDGRASSCGLCRCHLDSLILYSQGIKMMREI